MILKIKSYIWRTKDNDNNNININNANSQGFTKLVTVGPNVNIDDKKKNRIADLTLDGAINSGCYVLGIDERSGNTLNKVLLILIIYLTLFLIIKLKKVD